MWSNMQSVFLFIVYSGRHHPGCLWDFGGQKELQRRKYLYIKNKLAANFHVVWFISLLLLLLLIYPLVYTFLLVVKVLRHIFSLTTENCLMNGWLENDKRNKRMNSTKWKIPSSSFSTYIQSILVSSFFGWLAFLGRINNKVYTKLLPQYQTVHKCAVPTNPIFHHLEQLKVNVFWG